MYYIVCPKCNSDQVTREIIGTEYETVCRECGYWDSSDHFLSTTLILQPQTSIGSKGLATIKRNNMTELTNIKTQLATALEMIANYETKPTKAKSARIRKSLGEIKKSVTGVRAALVVADKA